MSTVARAFIAWLPLAVAITLVCGLIYVAVQQNYRTSLNDPQIQMAEDAASSVESGAAPGTVVTDTRAVDIRASLAPWIAAFDSSGAMIVSSGTLDGHAIALPSGVFNTKTWHTYAEDGFALPVPSDENRFTWQPESGVRQAVVLIDVHLQSGNIFIASGRNMREVENREGVLAEMVAIAWLVTMVATFMAQAFATYVL